jgi:DNA-binding transcriptional ArsR family regulator
MKDLDRIIHEPARLAIVALLSGAEEVEFTYLTRECGLTNGNLSSHLAKLESAGYIEIAKEFRGKVPMTLVRLTKEGRASFIAYRKAMNKMLAPKVPRLREAY